MKDDIAVVTGGTSGIGKEIVRQLLERGSFVYAIYGHDDYQMERTKEEFKSYQNSIVFIKIDISKESEIRRLFDIVKDQKGRLDYLINNAGINTDETIENANLDSYMSVISTNLIGKMLCIKYAISLLKKSEHASIINISSSLGIKPVAECSAYCCSASAIDTLTKCAALELENYNIRVNTVSPSFTPTPLSLSGWTEEEIRIKKEKNPRHRLGKVEDTANAVMFLLSNKADYINGENIKVNGGSLLK